MHSNFKGSVCSLDCAESGIEGIDTIVADVSDQASLEAMCSKATVLINCVGPVRIL